MRLQAGQARDWEPVGDQPLAESSPCDWEITKNNNLLFTCD